MLKAEAARDACESLCIQSDKLGPACLTHPLAHREHGMDAASLRQEAGDGKQELSLCQDRHTSKGAWIRAERHGSGPEKLPVFA